MKKDSMDSELQRQEENPFARILSNALAARLEGMASNAALVPVFQEILAFSQTLVDELEVSGLSPRVACSSGCTFCCHSQVNIIPLEALLMAGFVKEVFSGPQVQALRGRIDRSRAMTTGKSPGQIYGMKKDLPCVFLEAGTCSIYTARPSICRSWNSFDALACRAAYHSPDAASSVSSSEARNFIFGTARTLFQQLTRDRALQHNTLFLYNAMSDCFLDPDPLTQWARGELVFHYD